MIGVVRSAAKWCIPIVLFASACNDPCAKYRTNLPDAPWQPEAEVVVLDESTKQIVPRPTFEKVDRYLDVYAGCIDGTEDFCRKWHVVGSGAEVNAPGYASVRIGIPVPGCGGLIKHPDGCEYGCARKSYELLTVLLAPLPPDLSVTPPDANPD